MPDTSAQSGARFTILCMRCDRPVVACPGWVGKDVQCPHCFSIIKVPPMPADRRPVRAGGPDLSAKRQFHFPCPRCECLLEAHTAMCGQRATCPTCAARFLVPYLRPGSGLPEKALLLDAVADTPAPLHAYAARGDQAPRILRQPDGEAVIECPRCQVHNPIEALACTECATPFTLEAAPSLGQIRRDRQASLSVTLGLVGVLLFPLLIPGLLALWFGLRSLLFVGPARPSYLGLLGFTLGLLSVIGGAAFWYLKLR